MYPTFSVIGVGNMAKAVLVGIVKSNISLSKIYLYDKFPSQMDEFSNKGELFCATESVSDAVSRGDYVLLSVKPQNYDEVLSEIAGVEGHQNKIYISIGAGITSESVSRRLGGAVVIRVLPNVPMLIGMGVSVICQNPLAKKEDFEFVNTLFCGAGSTLVIDEAEMNRIIGVTSSSPAYVFRFIQAIYEGAIEQELPDRALLDAICDVVIGSAQLLKDSHETPDALIAKVASKGGTTEQALRVLSEAHFNETIVQAMIACTKRADELGKM